MFNVFSSVFKNLNININYNSTTNNNTEIIRDKLKDGGEGPQIILIPAGKFRMGDITSNGRDNEQPVHKVSVKSFYMGVFPVTFAEYDHFCEDTRHTLSLHEKRKKPDDECWGRGNRPVINVCWHDAAAYTEWLSEQTGQEYRLPTEAEWEYAARAGTETDYWWGNDIDETKANYNENLGKTSPVGDYDPNPFGLYDMLGNVREWTCSEYEDKYNGKEKVIISNKSDKNRVLRGGSWNAVQTYLRIAYRGNGTLDYRSYNRGFRVVRAAWT
jgi:formylglycine-generating enzyme required for sulfatase activity